MQFHIKPFRPHQTFLKEGGGRWYEDEKGVGRGGSLVGLGQNL